MDGQQQALNIQIDLDGGKMPRRPDDKQRVLRILNQVADYIEDKFDYRLSHSLAVRFHDELERSNDYERAILYLSNWEGELIFEDDAPAVLRGMSFTISGFNTDPSIIAHEYGHFVFWDMLGSRQTSGLPTTEHSTDKQTLEFHAIQEGWCDFLATLVYNEPRMGAWSWDPPLRDISDRDFERYRRARVPQFMGWGAFLWELNSESDALTVSVPKIIFDSIRYLDKKADFNAGVDALTLSCETLYARNTCAEWRKHVKTQFQRVFGDVRPLVIE